MDKKNIYSLLKEHNLVVPEIQREYVWGAVKNKKVMLQFLKDLDQKLATKTANIGFLYSYKSGQENYLIDGQQRYTTILLLLHYLSIIENKHQEFIKILRLDENITAFSYRVRSYTESFLQNLFSSESIDSKDIKDQCWYKTEYRQDPTVNSMLGAFDVFIDCVDDCKNISYSSIMNNVEFWYFDVGQTSQGEELYITMNSRGEKLTDSEQIKPRLFRRLKSYQKQSYGKKWDEWEEFFYAKSLRKNRDIDSIDTAMNNMIRVVLELSDKDFHEHDRIKPVEDSALIELADIEKYMEALQMLIEINDGKYINEVARLYGDSNSDGNFYVLKSLLTCCLRNPKNLQEYERVYQTVINQVRRNKIKNVAFLRFLNAYKNSSKDSFYDCILAYENDTENPVFTGHELEKIQICRQFGEETESALWTEQSRPFWYGEIKQLVEWSKKNQVFDVAEFCKVATLFNKVFNKNESVGWTSDIVRQALLTLGLSNFPTIENGYVRFGYFNWEWKTIIASNSILIRNFLELFSNKDEQETVNMLNSMICSYSNDSSNEWAEFVHYDFLLNYCNTKRVQNYRNEYGVECVKNSYKLPYSVKNMRLAEYIKSYLKDNTSCGWSCWSDQGGWKTTLVVNVDQKPYDFYIEYRQDKSKSFEVRVELRDVEESCKAQYSQKFIDLGFEVVDGILYKYVPEDYDKVVSCICEWANT